MHVNLVGINHRTAPIAIREKAAIRARKLQKALSLLNSRVPRGIILSTCNRTEVYTTTSDSRCAEEESLNFLKAHLSIPGAELPRYAYVLKDVAAVEHLFRIACGLDSMIVGEFEVLGQVGQALEIAEKAKMVNLPLRHIFQSAIRTGRRVREETGISKNALSVSSVAVDLAARVVGDLKSCKMLVIGAGEAGRLVVKAARDRGTSQIFVASRTRERASNLAAMLGGIPVGLDRLIEELNTCNIVVTCAAAPRWIVDVNHVAAAMRNRPGLPMVIIDIAVPRNVAPAVAQINNVFLYNIDDLTQLSDKNRRQREREIEKSEKIIAAEVAEFAAWWRALEVRPVISTLMRKAEDIRGTQLKKTIKKLRPLSDEEKDSLEAMTRSIVTKILQDPVRYLKENANSKGNHVEMVSELFGLDVEQKE
jgi:glutamyl-tRNA reductase